MTARGTHTCHWPGCDRLVPPAMWGCKQHWFALPKILRTDIWLTYRPGQEITKTPSPDYVRAAQRVQEWIRDFQQKTRESHARLYAQQGGDSNAH